MSLPSTFKQYALSQSGKYQDLAISEAKLSAPKPHQVVLKVHAVSLNYRDLMVASGRYTGAPIPEGFIPVSDAAGEVAAVGEGVTKWKVGDRVAANFAPEYLHGDWTPESQKSALGGLVDGVLAEYVTLPAHGLVPIPEHLSFEEAATLPCAAVTAYNALWGPVPVKPGDTVLVQGTGGVSIFALQFAVAAGARVIATSSSEDKLKIATKLGAAHVINYKTHPDWDQEVLKLTEGRGVDHVIEIGGAGTLEKSLQAVRVHGSVHIIGVLTAAPEGNAPVTFPLIRKVATLRGIFVGSVQQFNDMNRLIAANPETTRPVIDKVFAFEDAAKAYAHLESQAHVGKIVIKVA